MTAPSKVSELLRALAGAFLAHPEELMVVHQEALDGACLFGMQGEKEDEPRLIGAGGTHVTAFSTLVAAMGDRRNLKWSFKLVTSPGRANPAPNPPKDTLKHDPAPAMLLLSRVLKECLVGGFAVEISHGKGPRRDLTYAFSIYLLDQRDYARMVHWTEPDGKMKLIEAIGTLYRAIARSQGVRYELEVKSP